MHATDSHSFTISHFNLLDSTNTFLKNHLLNYPDYSVIWADEQQQGRGRFNRTWKTAPGRDLTFSILLPLDNLNKKHWPNISQITACAIIRLLIEYKMVPNFKWPNDVMVSNKKISGVLCERVKKDQTPFVVVGVGLNVNSDSKFLKQLDKPATSFYSELSSELSRQEILNKFLSFFSNLLDHLQLKGFLNIKKELFNQLMFKGEMISVTDGTNTFHQGILLDLNTDGTLKINCEKCGVINLSTGDINKPNFV